MLRAQICWSFTIFFMSTFVIGRLLTTSKKIHHYEHLVYAVSTKQEKKNVWKGFYKLLPKYTIEKTTRASFVGIKSLTALYVSSRLN